jgi:DNA mismatch endonuclease, patch repair protein
MAAIQSKDMKPEMVVRSMAYSLGYRFRLHRKDLPGTPDLVFPSRRAVIFVHGCFWHQHTECREGRLPSSRQEYWGPKLTRNVARDVACVLALNASGWRVLTVWECETKDASKLRDRLLAFLGPVSKRNVLERQP